LAIGVFVVALVTALTSNAAFARAPALKSVIANAGDVTYTWTLPEGVRAQFVEVSKFPDVNVNGYFNRGLFSFNVVGSSQTSLLDPKMFPQGTYYVHVAGADRVNLQCPRIEFSNMMLLSVAASGAGTAANLGRGSPACPGPGARVPRADAPPSDRHEARDAVGDHPDEP
jgi:hypothetical protein